MNMMLQQTIFSVSELVSSQARNHFLRLAKQEPFIPELKVICRLRGKSWFKIIDLGTAPSRRAGGGPATQLKVAVFFPYFLSWTRNWKPLLLRRGHDSLTQVWTWKTSNLGPATGRPPAAQAQAVTDERQCLREAIVQEKTHLQALVTASAPACGPGRRYQRTFA